ncbi:DUF5060 domain-containing protein [Candidatus Hydrogenedentota bacterium]
MKHVSKLALLCAIVFIVVSANAEAQIITSVTTTGPSVGLYDVFQITLSTSINIATLPNQNPWRDVTVTGTFTKQPGGTPVNVSGFFYQESPQKFAVRFMPQSPGSYNYSVGISTGGAPETRIGSFTVASAPSDPDNHGVLRINSTNRRQWKYEDGTQCILNGNSLHSGLDPQNLERAPNGIAGLSSYADFDNVAQHADDEGYITINTNFPTELSPYTVEQHFFDMIDKRLDEYENSAMNYLIVTLTHSDRFMGNVATNFRGLGEDSFIYPYQYNLPAGEAWDYFLEGARDRGINVKIEVHNYVDRWSQHPFLAIPGVAAVARTGSEDPIGFITDSTALDAWDKYVRYLNARYGAYSNVIWMMGNEFSGDQSTTSNAEETAFWDLHKYVWDNLDPYDHIRDTTSYVGAAMNTIGDQRLWHGPSSATTVGDGRVANDFYSGSPGVHTANDQPWLGEESTGFHRGLFTHVYRPQRWGGFVGGKYIQALSILGHLNTPQQNNFMRVFGEVIDLLDNPEGLLPQTGTALINNPKPVSTLDSSPTFSSPGFAEGIVSDTEAVIYMQRVTDDDLSVNLPTLTGKTWTARTIDARTGELLDTITGIGNGAQVIDMSGARTGTPVLTDAEGTARDAAPDMGCDELGAGAGGYTAVVPSATSSSSAIVRIRGGVETGFSDLGTALTGAHVGDIFELGGNGSTSSFTVSTISLTNGVAIRASAALLPTLPTIQTTGSNWQLNLRGGDTMTLQNLQLDNSNNSVNLRSGHFIFENVNVTTSGTAFYSNTTGTTSVLVEMNHCDIRSGGTGIDLTNSSTIVDKPVEYRIRDSFFSSGGTCVTTRLATLTFEGCELFSSAQHSGVVIDPQPDVDDGIPSVTFTNCLLRRSHLGSGADKGGHIHFTARDINSRHGGKLYGNLMMHHNTILNPLSDECIAIDDVVGNTLVEGKIELVNNLFAGGGMASDKTSSTVGVSGLPGTTGDILTYNNMIENLLVGGETGFRSAGAGELYEDRWNYFDLVADSNSNKISSDGFIYFPGTSIDAVSTNPQRDKFVLAATVNGATNPAVGKALPLPAYRNSDFVILIQAADLVAGVPGDSDGDGVSNYIEDEYDTDGDGILDRKETDADADGILDGIEGSEDEDSDGLANYRDTDADGDGLADASEGTGDPDRDGKPNFLDTDSDNDGVSDGSDPTPYGEPVTYTLVPVGGMCAAGLFTVLAGAAFRRMKRVA